MSVLTNSITFREKVENILCCVIKPINFVLTGTQSKDFVELYVLASSQVFENLARAAESFIAMFCI